MQYRYEYEWCGGMTYELVKKPVHNPPRPCLTEEQKAKNFGKALKLLGYTAEEIEKWTKELWG